eukprot:m.76368 g.76368  ORF g.76368 m.76368 type:complete len:134 (+) comp35982_c0_seq17:944-1345(+)
MWRPLDRDEFDLAIESRPVFHPSRYGFDPFGPDNSVFHLRQTFAAAAAVENFRLRLGSSHTVYEDLLNLTERLGPALSPGLSQRRTSDSSCLQCLISFFQTLISFPLSSIFNIMQKMKTNVSFVCVDLKMGKP